MKNSKKNSTCFEPLKTQDVFTIFGINTVKEFKELRTKVDLCYGFLIIETYIIDALCFDFVFLCLSCLLSSLTWIKDIRDWWNRIQICVV